MFLLHAKVISPTNCKFMSDGGHCLQASLLQMSLLLTLAECCYNTHPYLPLYYFSKRNILCWIVENRSKKLIWVSIKYYDWELDTPDKLVLDWWNDVLNITATSCWILCVTLISSLGSEIWFILKVVILDLRGKGPGEWGRGLELRTGHF